MVSRDIGKATVARTGTTRLGLLETLTLTLTLLARTTMSVEEQTFLSTSAAHKALREFFKDHLSEFTLGASLAKAENPSVYVGLVVQYDGERIVPVRFQYHIFPAHYPAGIVLQMDGRLNMMPVKAHEVSPTYEVQTVDQWVQQTSVRPMHGGLDR